MLSFEDIPVYPSDDQWGNLLLSSYADSFQADLVIALMDAWVLRPDVFRDVPFAVWTPVDHQPCPPRVAEFFRQSGARTIAMSRFGEQMLRDEGLDPLYVPHGIDTNVFQPGNRDLIREAAGLNDSFLVGIVANNSGGMPPASGPPRKAFPQSIMAFSAFYRKHPDAKLYLHTELSGRQHPGNIKPGLNMARLLDRFEVPLEAVKTTDQLSMELGIDSAAMADLYSSFDVLLNPSYGEGFGIPIVEAQACGTPVIVTDWTSMPELCGAGWKVDGEPWYDPQHEAFFMCPSVGCILEALEDAYENAAGMRDQAREFALAYDADLVTETYWKPALEALGRPREVGPLPNRAMRRAKKVAA
jgi:glycosyltransferase involved in cell wall biosynthesis